MIETNSALFDIYDEMETDERAEVEGVWIDFRGGSRIKVARWRNKYHLDVMEKLRIPYLPQLQAGGELPDDISTAITIKAMAKAILLDWEGFTRGGEPLPHSEKAALKLLTEVKDFRLVVTAFSSASERYLKSTILAMAKNLELRSDKPSAGKGKTGSKPQPS